MHKLSINTGSTVWALLFKEKEGVDAVERAALKLMTMQHLTQTTAGDKVLTIEDDYGQRAHLVAGSIHGVLSEDLDLVQEAMIRMHLLNQQTNVKAQQRLQNDPTLKAASLGNNGGVMFDPMAGRRFS